DAVEPFLSAARQFGRGLFVVLRTSNPGAGLFQDLVCNGRPLYHYVADAVAAWSRQSPGTVGAVVGATHAAELKLLREQLPDVWFLVPGYGAQGGTAADVRAAFWTNGLGAVVNSSRGVTFPFAPDETKWGAAVERAVRAAAEELPGAAR